MSYRFNYPFLLNKPKEEITYALIYRYIRDVCTCMCNMQSLFHIFLQMENVTYPVMVWIHGGGFQVGSAADYHQNPILRNFVSKKVIFVTVNYRLGPFGQ